MSNFNSTRAATNWEAPPSVKKAFRADIQGLRTVAVLAVIADHMFGYPLGGFVGVDVFFVLSGFLITGLMLREFDKTGKISFSDFYRRRIRRIMPVALFVLVVTTAASWFLFLGERPRSITIDAALAAVFGANWRFAAMGTDYLQSDGPVSPLQHYWSLSVEEQFYLVWPALLVLVLGVLAARFGWEAIRARRVLTSVIVVVTLASLAFALWETQANPTVAYFSTFSRAWELGIGALIAVLAPACSRIPAVLRPILQWLGLIGIIASLFLITPETAFPAPGALLPVLATALVVAGGVGGQRFMAPLTNTASRYIGDISYSLYLWHFPVIVLGAVIAPSMGVIAHGVSMGLILMLSVASYHFIEDPLRRSQWLEPKAHTRRGSPTPHLTFRTKMLGIALITVAAIGVNGLAFMKTAPLDDAAIAGVAVPAVPNAEASGAPTSPEDAQQAEIATALNAASWPELQPKIEDLGLQGFSKEDSEGCAPATPRGKDCSVPVGDKVAVVVGDSTAAAWMPTIRAILEPEGWSVTSLTYVGCPFIAEDTVAADPSITDACPEHKALVRSLIAESKPGLVFASNAYNQRIVSAGDQPSLVAWEAGAQTAKADWLADAGKVITLASPPGGKNPTECITRVSLPSDCISTTEVLWDNYVAADKRASTTDGNAFINTKPLFCVGSRCPLFVDGIIVRRDASHITTEYATKVAPLIADEIKAQLEQG